MKKELTIGKRISIGYSIILVIAIILGVSAWIGFSKITGAVHVLTEANDLRTEMVQREVDHLKWMSKLRDFIFDDTVNELKINLDHTSCGLGKWLYGEKSEKAIELFPHLAENVNKMKEPHKHLHESAGEIKKAMLSSNSLDGFLQAKEVFETKTKSSVKNVQKHLYHIAEEAISASKTEETNAQKTISKTNSLLGIVLFAAVLIGLVISVYTVKILSSKLTFITQSLHSSADQVSSASGQLAGSSQGMAQRASQQAAGLQGVSAALEEMASTTRQNADNAKQANSVAHQTKDAAERSQEAMGRMSSAISSIQEASDKTAEIVKTIDEIAFQTNLLALNAAVEAARAGDAGKGFAVVAEEVRSLAQRSAAAAKDTSDLIRGSLDNAKNGVAVSVEVESVLKEIVEKVHNVTQLAGEVSAASEEQALGINQINETVTEMDKITQENAAGAQEAASSSEELSAQSKEVREMIENLRVMVQGR